MRPVQCRGKNKINWKYNKNILAEKKFLKFENIIKRHFQTNKSAKGLKI